MSFVCTYMLLLSKILSCYLQYHSCFSCGLIMSKGIIPCMFLILSMGLLYSIRWYLASVISEEEKKKMILHAQHCIRGKIKKMKNNQVTSATLYKSQQQNVISGHVIHNNIRDNKVWYQNPVYFMVLLWQRVFYNSDCKISKRSNMVTQRNIVLSAS